MQRQSARALILEAEEAIPAECGNELLDSMENSSWVKKGKISVMLVKNLISLMRKASLGLPPNLKSRTMSSVGFSFVW